jgi:hypothetical protein
MPFATAGIGGGASLPCGAQYDVQINQPLNHFGCDTGVFTENNSTHTLNMGTAGTPGNVVTNEINLIAGGGATFPGSGVGLFAPSGANVQFKLPGAVGTDGQALVQLSHSGNTAVIGYGNGGGSYNYENLYPLFTTNCPLPDSPCTNDLISTLLPQNVSTQLMGPPPGSGPGSFVYQSNICQGVGATASCAFLGPSKPGHAYAMLALYRGSGATVGDPTDTAGNTFTPIVGPGSTPVVAYAANVAGPTMGVPIDTISQNFNDTYSWIMIVEEIGDVPTSSPVEVSDQGGSCSGTTLSFAPVTTSGTDLIVGFNYANPAGGASGNSIYSATSPWFVDQQLTLNTGGLFPFMTVASIHGLEPPGAITPVANATNCAAGTVTIAFRTGTSNEWNLPRFRYPTITDWVQQGLIGDPTAVPIGWVPTWTGNINQPFQWQANGSGGGGVGSFSSGNLPPLFTTSVSNPTTNPVQTFTLSNAGPNTIFGNWSGGSGVPSYNTMLSGGSCGDPTHATGWTAGTGFFCQALVTGGDTITSPNGTLAVGGSTTNTTLDVIGATSGVGSVPQQYTSTPSGVPGWTVSGTPINAQTGTSYTFLATDRGKWVTFNNSSAVAVGLPQAGTTGFATNIMLIAKNLGAGTVTVTPTTSTIDGGSTLTIVQGQSCVIFSDNTNYFSQCGNGKITAGANITLTPSAAGVQIAASGGGGTGTINNAAQYLMPFYSASGTANTLSGATGITTDSSQNNLILVGGITTGSGGGAAGFYDFINGTGHIPTANSFSIQAATSISQYFGWVSPAAENSSAGVLHIGAASSHLSALTIGKVTSSDIDSTIQPTASPTFTGTATLPATVFGGITGSTQCLHVNSSGTVSGTGVDCGSGSVPSPTFVFVFPGVPTSGAYALQAGFSSTIPANFSTPTAVCTCGTNPASSEVFTLLDGSSTVGTITLNSSCSATLATTGGTTYSISANDRLKLSSTTTDASGADYVCSIPTT